jgi:orotate phosphoribosyltransferase
MTAAFPDKSVIAELTAKMFLEVEAVRFMAEKPFIFTSGWASPVYTDCRRLISFPRVRDTLMDFGVATVLREIGFDAFDAVAGGETAGIPFAAWIADRLSLPMLYVRKKAKGFGRNAQIEGHLVEGQRVLLVEDLTSDGRSKINFCKALRDAGAKVEHIFVLFFYDIFPEGPLRSRRQPARARDLVGRARRGQGQQQVRSQNAGRGRSLHAQPRGVVASAWRRRRRRRITRNKFRSD